MKHRISVIIPVYNTSCFLDRCISSVCNQTYTNLEIIVVDDGSTDNSYEICKKWADSDSRILLLQKENGGISSARNFALDKATGEYIGFVDSDDWIEPDMYESLLNAIIDLDTDAAICKEGVTDWGTEAIYTQLLRDDIGSQLWKFLFSAQLWQDLRMPIGRLAEDAAVIPKLLHNRKIASVDKILYHYYAQNPSSVSNTQEKRFKNTIDRAIVFSERYDWIKEKATDRKTLQIVLCKATCFVIGTVGRYEVNRYAMYADDVAQILRFLRHNLRSVIWNGDISIIKKIASILICVNPKIYYRIKNMICK